MNARIDAPALTAADFVEVPAVPAQQPQPVRVVDNAAGATDGIAESLALLFSTSAAQDFRSRWDAVQIGFVDDPGQAVQKADELVAQVMKNLAETFSAERARIEGQFKHDGEADTENLRVALRRYRSFFHRLLAL